MIEDDLPNSRTGTEASHAETFECCSVGKTWPSQEIERQDDGLDQLLDGGSVAGGRDKNRIGASFTVQTRPRNSLVIGLLDRDKPTQISVDPGVDPEINACGPRL